MRSLWRKTKWEFFESDVDLSEGALECEGVQAANQCTQTDPYLDVVANPLDSVVEELLAEQTQLLGKLAAAQEVQLPQPQVVEKTVEVLKVERIVVPQIEYVNVEVLQTDVAQLTRDFDWLVAKLNEIAGQEKFWPILGTDRCVSCGEVILDDYAAADPVDFIACSQDAIVPSFSGGWICGMCEADKEKANENDESDDDIERQEFQHAQVIKPTTIASHCGTCSVPTCAGGVFCKNFKRPVAAEGAAVAVENKAPAFADEMDMAAADTLRPTNPVPFPAPRSVPPVAAAETAAAAGQNCGRCRPSLSCGRGKRVAAGTAAAAGQTTWSLSSSSSSGRGKQSGSSHLSLSLFRCFNVCRRTPRRQAREVRERER